MECNKDEALRAKEIAERKFESKDLQGAKKFALKAKALFPGLEGIVQMITTLDIYLNSEVKIAGEKDWYSILSVDMLADDETLKKQYRKLVLQLHPDKNKSVGAEGAFQMVKEAWTVMSHKTKRALYDQKRKLVVFQQKTSQSNKASAAPGAANGFDSFVAKAAASKARANKKKAGSATSAVRQRWPPSHQAPAPAPPSALSHTYWTSCNKCKMQFEYIKVYLNQTLLCPSCREPFLAKEELMPPTENVHAVQDSKTGGANQDASTGRNVQWGPFSRTAGVSSATASSSAAAQAANVVHQTYEKVKREREEAQAAARKEDALQKKYSPLKRQSNMSETVNLGIADGASGKKMRAVGKDAGVGSSSILSGPGANYFRMPGGSIPFSTNSGAYEFQHVHGGPSWKPRPPTRISVAKSFSQLDIRGILIDKMKNDLRDKLKEIRSKTVEVAANGKEQETCG